MTTITFPATRSSKLFAYLANFASMLIFAIAVGSTVAVFLLVEQQKVLTSEVQRLTVERNVAMQRAVAAETKLSMALVPEATVSEVWQNRVTAPVVNTASKAYQYTASKASEAIDTVRGWFQ